MSAERLIIGLVLGGGAVLVVSRMGGLEGILGSATPVRLAPEPEPEPERWYDGLRDAAVDWGADRLGGWLDNLVGGDDGGATMADGTAGFVSWDSWGDASAGVSPSADSGGGGLAWPTSGGGASGGLGWSLGSPAPSGRRRSGGAAGGNIRPLLDLIGRHEAGAAGYDAYYLGAKIAPPRPISTMTVREVQAWQARNKAAGSASTAAGRYQVISGTMSDIIRAGDLSRDEVYDADAQDRAALSRLRYRGLDKYRSGQISDVEFGQRLSQEWAAFPAQTRDRRGRRATGQSYWAGVAGNAAGTSKSAVLAAVRRI